MGFRVARVSEGSQVHPRSGYAPDVFQVRGDARTVLAATMLGEGSRADALRATDLHAAGRSGA